jgi:cytochrome c oxidase subunit 3
MGLLPGYYMTNAELPSPDQAHIFFGIYFLMTGLHGIHVVIGMIVLIWLFYRTYNNEFNPQYYSPLEIGGLYWHLVDVIWIFLFPMLYLIR